MMKPKIALLIIFMITILIPKSFGENASGVFWFEVADQGIVNRVRSARGGQPIEMGLLAMYMAYFYVVQPNPMIQLPLVFNNQWSGKVFSEVGANWIGKTTLESRIQVVTVPAGTFSNCLKLKTEIRLAAGGPSSDFVSGTRYIWFAPGVGLIKVEYHHGNEKVTHILLKEYTIGEEEGKRDYFPLNKGMEWKYDWHNDYYDVIVEEECYATGEKMSLWPGVPECLPIFCKNELSSRTAKGWPPEFPIFEGIDSRNKLSTTWGYIKGTF